METIYDVIVVGGGAAGLLAAGRAAELGGRVLVLEKMERAGRKMLISGKGRCNITNDSPLCEFLQHIHPESRFVKHAFSRFFSHDIIRLLKEHGCDSVVERGNRVFPVSNKAADVVRALLQWVGRHRVEIRYGHKVDGLVIEEGAAVGVRIHSRGASEVIRARHVICCTGGKSYPSTGSDGDGYRFAAALGHALEPPRQALVPVETAGNVARRLQGLSLRNVKAMVRVDGHKAKEAFGEMAFTEFGLSGPIILTLSRFIVDELRRKSSVELAIDFKPALNEAKLDARLARDVQEFGHSRMDQLCRKWLPAAMIPVFLERVGIDSRKSGCQLNAREMRAILDVLKDFRLEVTGCRPFKEAIITAGGVLTSQVDPLTMESKLVKRLYLAGEILDLDADTGGYNLQIAFSTGWLAGEACMMDGRRL